MFEVEFSRVEMGILSAALHSRLDALGNKDGYSMKIKDMVDRVDTAVAEYESRNDF